MNNADDHSVEKHPSYAMMGFSRGSRSGAVPLFGSSIKHSETISLRIAEAQVDRHLNKDWYYSDLGSGYIEVEMSYSQFAEAISAMNIGCGVPVTLRSLNGQRIENCPYVDKRQQFQAEFSEDIRVANKTISDLIDTVTELFESKKPLTKAEKEQVLTALSAIERGLGSSLSFTFEQFNRQMDKTMNEAKGEIESFMQNKLNSIALAALGEKLDMTALENGMRTLLPEAATVPDEDEPEQSGGMTLY